MPHFTAAGVPFSVHHLLLASSDTLSPLLLTVHSLFVRLTWNLLLHL